MADNQTKEMIESTNILNHIKHKYKSGSLTAKNIEENLSFDDEILKEHNKFQEIS